MLIMLAGCGLEAHSGLPSIKRANSTIPFHYLLLQQLLRQDPIHKVLDLRHIICWIGLDDLVILLVPVREFGLLAGGDMVDQFFFGVGLALELLCDLLIRGTVFILRYRMALEAVIGAGQLPGGRFIDCTGSRGEQQGGDANHRSDRGDTSTKGHFTSP